MKQKYKYKSYRKLLIFATLVSSVVTYFAIRALLGLEVVPPRSYINPRAVGVFLLISGLGIFIAVPSFISFVRSFTKARFIILSESYLSAPQGAYSFKISNVPLKDIESMESRDYYLISRKVENLTLRHKGGKLVLHDDLFETRVKFVSFKQALKKNCQVAKSD